MKLLLIGTLIPLWILSCSNRETKLSDSCMDIIESDSFYFALPLDEGQYKAIYRLENYVTQIVDSQVLTIDYDCAVAVNPTDEQFDKLREILGQDFDENRKINTRHSEAVSCMIESNGIRTLTPAARFLRFIGKKRTWDLDIRKDTFPDWKFILFNKTKEPVVLPSISVRIEEVEQYFRHEK